MPMSFPDIRSLEMAAKIHGFRAPLKGESEADFREALADHVKPIDIIESMEIRTSRGWDEWTDNDKQRLFQPSNR